MLNRKYYIRTWCIYFWCIFAIQLLPVLLGGIINVLLFGLFTCFMALFYVRSPQAIVRRSDRGFLLLFIGILIYGIETTIVLNERSQVNLYIFSVNYSFYKMCFWVCGLICALVFVRKSSAREFRVFNKMFTAVILINAVSNIIITTFLDSTASKYAGKTNFNMIIGTSDFDMIYATVIVFPIFFSKALHEKGRARIGYIIISLILGIYVFKASFFIALMALALGMGLIIINTMKNKQLITVIYILIFGIVFFCISNIEIVYHLMLLIASKINNIHFSVRIVELVDVLRNGGEMVDAAIRLDIYLKVLAGFIRHPFVGNIIMDPSYFLDHSGHSTILDFLAGYGLIVCLPLYLGFHRVVMSMKASLRQGRAVFVSCYAVFVFIAAFNPVTNGYLLLATILAVPFSFMAEAG